MVLDVVVQPVPNQKTIGAAGDVEHALAPAPDWTILANCWDVVIFEQAFLTDEAPMIPGLRAEREASAT
jgi:hypothetical protein